MASSMEPQTTEENESLISGRGRSGRSRGRNRRNRGANSKPVEKVETWCVRDGEVEDHFKVWPLARIVLFPCIGALLVGFDTGGCAWMMIAIRYCSNKYDDWCDIVESNTYIGAGLEAMHPFGGCLACIIMYLIGGNRIGGRTELIMSSMFFTIGSTLEAESAELNNSIAGLYICFFGRIVYGFGSGLCLHSISNYIAENSPPHLRGALTGFIEIFMTIGIIYGYAIGQWLTYEFPYQYPWKYTFKFATLFGIVMFFGMLSLPESPRWLVSVGRPLYEALEASQFINPDIHTDHIVAMKKDIERQAPRPIDGVELVGSRIWTPALRKPLIVGLGLMIAHQVTGLPAMLYYIVEIFQEVAPSELMIALSTFAACKVIGGICVMLYLDTWGRRIPLICGLTTMVATSLSVFLLFYYGVQRESSAKWFFVILIDLFVIGFEFSVGSVTFVLLGEIYPGDCKGDALSIIQIVNFFLSASMIFFLYWEISSVGYSVVWGQFSLTAFLFTIFAVLVVPETMGKTLEQIQIEFLEEFDVPDFMDAMDYFDQRRGDTDTETENEGTEDNTNPLVSDGAAAAAEEGGATATATPLQVDSAQEQTSGKNKKPTKKK